jgi:hypothetical protein
MTGELSPAGREPAVPGDLRASHADRDAVVERLRDAAGDGRLTADELDQRLELALTARTYGELAALTTDLPAQAGAALPVPAGPRPEAAELVRIKVTSGNSGRDGAWVLPRRMECGVTSGNVKLDFTRAVLTERVLQLDADVRSGNVTLITRPGIVVDAGDVNIGSGNVKVTTPWKPGTPEELRIVISGRVRSGNITARPPRRSFWQWLRREPLPYAASRA